MENRIDMLVERVRDIPTLPSVVAQINRILHDDRGSLDGVVSMIDKDPPLTSKALRLANSSYYGMCRKVRTVKEAILILGLNTIRSISMAVSVGKLFREDACEVLDMKELWIHSLHCAVACKVLMKEMGTVVAEEGFICGLIHDIGKAIMAVNLPAEMKEVGRAVAAEGERSWWEVERELVGFTHAEVGGLITRRWNFPQAYCLAIENHHWPERSNGKGKTAEGRLAHCIFVADALVRSGAGNGTDDIQLPDPAALGALEIEPDAYSKLAEKIQGDFKDVMEDWGLE